MDALAPPDIFLFEGFCLDRRGGGLFRQDEGGVSGPVAIGSRALDVLGVLIDRRGDLLSRDEIMTAAWPGTVVEANNLAVQISALRRLLDHDRIEGSCIQTVPGRGYRFVAAVTRAEPASPPVSARPATAAAGSAPRMTDRNIQARRANSVARCPYRLREGGLGFGAASSLRSSALWASALPCSRV